MHFKETYQKVLTKLMANAVKILKKTKTSDSVQNVEEMIRISNRNQVSNWRVTKMKACWRGQPKHKGGFNNTKVSQTITNRKFKKKKIGNRKLKAFFH